MWEWFPLSGRSASHRSGLEPFTMSRFQPAVCAQYSTGDDSSTQGGGKMPWQYHHTRRGCPRCWACTIIPAPPHDPVSRNRMYVATVPIRCQVHHAIFGSPGVDPVFVRVDERTSAGANVGLRPGKAVTRDLDRTIQVVIFSKPSNNKGLRRSSTRRKRKQNKCPGSRDQDYAPPNPDNSQRTENTSPVDAHATNLQFAGITHHRNTPPWHGSTVRRSSLYVVKCR